MGYDIYKLNQEIQKLAPNILKEIPVVISELDPIIGDSVKDILSSAFELVKKGTNVYTVINYCDENVVNIASDTPSIGKKERTFIK